jgi:hypothetical protein
MSKLGPANANLVRSDKRGAAGHQAHVARRDSRQSSGKFALAFVSQATTWNCIQGTGSKFDRR